MDISIKNITKSFNGKNVLTDINLDIKSGEVFSLIGPNGSGKTTLVRLLLNLYEIESGKITINGISVKDKKFEDLKYKIGFLLDNIGLFKDLTAEENLEFFHRIYKEKYDNNKRKSEIYELLKLVNLYDEKNRKVTFFSRGMKQRLCIARTLINNPSLIILDEPLRGLDLEGKFIVREIIEKLTDKNCTVFINSHNLDEVERISNHIAFIKDGKIVENGSLNDLKNKYKINKFIVTVENIEKWIDKLKIEKSIKSLDVKGNELHVTILESTFNLYDWFEKNSIDIISIKSYNGSLEDIYKEIINI